MEVCSLLNLTFLPIKLTPPLSVLYLYLQGVDLERLLKAINTLLELLVAEVQQGFGTHGSGTVSA